jgi:hypothetical protein
VSDQRAYVKNAADPDQVRRAGRKVADLERISLESMRVVMKTQEGRFVMWSLLERFGIFRSIWENSAKIHYNAGRQDAGHELQALLLQASEGDYDLMCREARARAQKAERENAATHQSRVDQES